MSRITRTPGMRRARRISRWIGAVAATAVIAGCGGTSTPSTTVSTQSTTALPAGAATYSDPQGRYSMSYSPAWSDREMTDGKAWYLASGNPTSGPNIGITVEALPSALTAEEYVESALKLLPSQLAGFDLESNESVTLPSGDSTVRLRYTAEISGQPVAFLQLATVSGQNAVVATLGAEVDDIDDAIAIAEPYMRTLDVTG